MSGRQFHSALRAVERQIVDYKKKGRQIFGTAYDHKDTAWTPGALLELDHLKDRAKELRRQIEEGSHR